MRLIAKGATSQTVYFSVNDSASTTGGKKTGILFNAAGLVASYTRNGAARTAITLATQTASGAWSSGGWIEVDATNEPGLYRFDVPDAAFASGVDSVVIQVRGATGMVDAVEEVQLTAVNLQDAVRGGMTALPNANAGANGGLPTGNASGRVDVGNWLGTAVTAATAGVPDVNTARVNNVSAASVTTVNANQGTTQPVNFTGTAGSALVKADAIDLAGTALTGRDIGASVLLSAGTGAGQLDFTSGVVKANLAQILGTALTETAGQIAAAFKQFFNIASPTSTMNTITTVTTATNLTTNNDKTGYALSAGGVQAIWDALTSALTTVGSVGKRIADNLDVVLSTRLATSGYTAPPTAAAVSTQVWTEPIPGAFGAGSAGAKLNSASAAGDPWATALPGAYGAGTGGNILGNLVASVWNAVAATYNAAGSMGQKLNAAGGAADPLTNAVPGSYAAGTAGYALGHIAAGKGALTVTLTEYKPGGSVLLAGVECTVFTDVGMTSQVAGPVSTDTFGNATFYLDAGTYYVKRMHPSYTFTNPKTIVVS